MRNRYLSSVAAVAIAIIVVGCGQSRAYTIAVNAAKKAAQESSKSFIGGIAGGGTGAAGVMMGQLNPEEKTKVLINGQEMAVDKGLYLQQLRADCYLQEKTNPEKCITSAKQAFTKFCVENCKLDE